MLQAACVAGETSHSDVATAIGRRSPFDFAPGKLIGGCRPDINASCYLTCYT